MLVLQQPSWDSKERPCWRKWSAEQQQNPDTDVSFKVSIQLKQPLSQDGSTRGINKFSFRLTFSFNCQETSRRDISYWQVRILPLTTHARHFILDQNLLGSHRWIQQQMSYCSPSDSRLLYTRLKFRFCLCWECPWPPSGSVILLRVWQDPEVVLFMTVTYYSKRTQSRISERKGS